MYEFSDVPLYFGMNLFQLVFYGPRGERREERYALNVADQQTPPGQVYYSVAGVDPREAKPRAMADVDFGITPHLAASAALSSVEHQDERFDYAQAALTSAWQRLASRVDAAVDAHGASALSASVQTRLGQLFVTASHAVLTGGFQSDQFVPLYGTIASRSRLYLHGAVPMPGIRLLPLSLEIQRDLLNGGGAIDSVTARVAASRRGFAVSNEIRLQRAASDSGLNQTTGLFMLSRYGPRLSVRGELEYQLAPQGELTAISMTASPRWSDRYTLDVGLRRLTRGSENHVLASLTKLQGAFGLGVTLDYSPEAGTSASLNFLVGVAREPRTGSWDADARPIAAMGAASLRAFLDENANGRWDEGEPLLQGVGFAANGVPQQSRTAANGTLVVYQLPSFTNVVFSAVSTTLEDPMWVPAEGVALLPRPGTIIPVDFPIVPTGEVTGTVYLESQGQSRQAPGVALQLVDSHGTIVREGRSAYDGFYDLARVPPGAYTLRVDETHAARLGAAPAARDIQLLPSAANLDGVDLVLHGEASNRAKGR